MAIIAVNLPTTHDTSSYKDDPNSIRGASTSIKILSYDTSWYLGYVFIKNDFSALSGVPASNITKAEIHFYYYGHQENDPTYAIKRVLADWDEMTLTWNNQPARSASYLDCPALSGYGWKSHDVTTMVKEWVAGTYPNYGLAFEGISIGTRQHSYLYSKEYNSGSHAPYIYVEYEESSAPSIKFAQII